MGYLLTEAGLWMVLSQFLSSSSLCDSSALAGCNTTMRGRVIISLFLIIIFAAHYIKFMSLNKAFIAELRSEATATRKLLALVPADQKEWVPHEKSMKLGRLATHVAELSIWVVRAVQHDSMDLMKDWVVSPTFDSGEELVSQFDKNLEDAIAALESITDEALQELWTLKRGEMVLFTMPKKVVIRSMAMNHFIHHRAQLGVYLRLLDVPIPGMYGPSADDER